jgi:outer membrane protein assembly factor BamB
LTYYTDVLLRAAITSNFATGRRPRARAPWWAATVVAFAMLAHGSGVLATDRPPIPDRFPGDRLWEIRLPAIPAQPPVFDDRHAYVALRDGTLVALSLANGSTVWSVPRPVSLPLASSAGVLLGVHDSVAWAVDCLTGQTKWERDVGAPGALAPTASGDLGVVLTAEREVVVLNLTNGSIVRRSTLRAQPTVVPAIAKDRLFVALPDGEIQAFDCRSGGLIWTRRLAASATSLNVVDNQLYAGGTDKFLYALDTARGGVRWRWRTGGGITAATAADTRRTYVVSLDSSLRALGRQHGDLKWQTRLSSRPHSGPVIDLDYVVVPGVAPELRAYKALDGSPAGVELLAGRPIHVPHFIPLSGGVLDRLVVVTSSGQVVALSRAVEPPVVPLDPIPGTIQAPETANLVCIDYMPGTLLPKETRPVIR